MGNSKSVYEEIKEEKFATFSEIISKEIPCPAYKVTRFSAYGDSVKEATERLRLVCKHHGIPEPLIHPETKTYYCGYIDIEYWRGIKKRLNPCYFKKQNERYLAYVYYHKM